MTERLKAEVIPWSTIVGTGLLLTNPEGKVVAQLKLMSVHGDRADYLEMAGRVADAINAGQVEEA